MDSVSDTASVASGAAHDAISATRSAASSAASTVRGAADAATERAKRTVEAMTQASQGGMQRMTEGYSYLSREQPLVLGALALVVGAAVGAVLPATRNEDAWLGATSDETKSRLQSGVQSKADDLQAAAMSAVQSVKESMSTGASGTADDAEDGDARPHVSSESGAAEASEGSTEPAK